MKIVPVMGLCFMAAGVLASLTHAWSQWIMGAAFGGLHICLEFQSPGDTVETGARATDSRASETFARADSGGHPSQAGELDRLIHERLRLGIVSALAVTTRFSFSDLKKLMKTQTATSVSMPEARGRRT